MNTLKQLKLDHLIRVPKGEYKVTKNHFMYIAHFPCINCLEAFAHNPLINMCSMCLTPVCFNYAYLVSINVLCQ